MQQLLRGGDIAVVAEAALLRHGPAIARLPCLHLLDGSRAGRAATLHLLNYRLACFARGVTANIIVAIAHDGGPCADEEVLLTNRM